MKFPLIPIVFVLTSISLFGGEDGLSRTSIIAYYNFNGEKISLSQLFFGDRESAKKISIARNNDKEFIKMLVRERRGNPTFSGILVLRKWGHLPKVKNEFVAECFSFLDPPNKKTEKEEQENQGVFHLMSSCIIYCYSDIAVIDYKMSHGWRLLPNPRKCPIPKLSPEQP